MADHHPWTYMRQRADTAGLLGKQLFVIHTRPAAGGLDAIFANLKEHLAFQKDLEERGIMFAAGPLGDEADPDRWIGDGLVVIRAETLDAAREIAASDPMHRAGARSYTVRPWLVNEGTLTVRIGFASGRRELI